MIQSAFLNYASLSALTIQGAFLNYASLSALTIQGAFLNYTFLSAPGTQTWVKLECLIIGSHSRYSSFAPHSRYSSFLLPTPGIPVLLPTPGTQVFAPHSRYSIIASGLLPNIRRPSRRCAFQLRLLICFDDCVVSFSG